MREIDIVAAEPALGEHHRDVGGERALRLRAPHRPPCGRAAAAAAAGAARRPSSVMRPSASIAPSSRSSAFASVERGARRRIEEGERRRIGDAPMREIEHEAGQIGGEDFRPVGGFERRGLRLVPQPVADARLGASGAAAPLVGGGARDAHGFEPRQAHVRLVARHAREPAIDHDAHALDGERGLGDRGREHDLAPARRRRRDRAVLHLGFERAVERARCRSPDR